MIKFVNPLENIILQIGGIGKVTGHILRDVFGINTCEEMVEKGSFICALFSNSTADFFLSVGLGLGGTATPQIRSRESMSNERTFSATEDKAFLYRTLAAIQMTLMTDVLRIWNSRIVMLETWEELDSDAFDRIEAPGLGI
ncbi:hypothetical protein Patl1_37415 [Pistacia atlantica]|nr:hypothetical protein Patl1_37415 [Pistacia atlantica]